MKNLISIALIALCLSLGSSDSFAQNDQGKPEDLGRIALNAWVSPQVEGLPASAHRMLTSKLAQIATESGMGGSPLNTRFILTPNITVLTKDLTSTAPPMTALTLEIALFIGDGIDGTIFANEAITVKGVGQNETKAYMAGIKQLNPKHASVQSFVENGKNKIIAYYNGRCDFIIKEAETLAAQNDFGGAILTLTSVPEVCKECYDKCMDKVGPYFKQYIDRDCKLKLAEANNVWNAGLDLAAANTASSYLSQIDPESACYKEAQALTAKIGKRVLELDKREWDFKLATEVDLEKRRIQAARDVGVAYGNNQPKSVEYNVIGWW